MAKEHCERNTPFAVLQCGASSSRDESYHSLDVVVHDRLVQGGGPDGIVGHVMRARSLVHQLQKKSHQDLWRYQIRVAVLCTVQSSARKCKSKDLPFEDIQHCLSRHTS